jgi:hypothetical protein
MLLPVTVVQVTDADAIGSGRVGKKVILEIDAHMRHLTLTVGEEEDITLFEL